MKPFTTVDSAGKLQPCHMTGSTPDGVEGVDWIPGMHLSDEQGQALLVANALVREAPVQPLPIDGMLAHAYLKIAKRISDAP